MVYEVELESGGPGERWKVCVQDGAVYSCCWRGEREVGCCRGEMCSL